MLHGPGSSPSTSLSFFKGGPAWAKARPSRSTSALTLRSGRTSRFCRKHPLARACNSKFVSCCARRKLGYIIDWDCHFCTVKRTQLQVVHTNSKLETSRFSMFYGCWFRAHQLDIPRGRLTRVWIVHHLLAKTTPPAISCHHETRIKNNYRSLGPYGKTCCNTVKFGWTEIKTVV